MSRRWSLFRKSRRERELDAELRFHLEQQVEANLGAGLSREEARRRALLTLGGLEQVKEGVREIRPGAWLEALGRDLRFGARMLRKDPGFTTVAVLSLALGIGANTAIFSIVSGVLLRPLPFPEPDRLVFIQQTRAATVDGGEVTQPDGEPLPVSPPNFVDFRRMTRSFERMGASVSVTQNFTSGEPESIDMAAVTPGFLDALAVAPRIGRLFQDSDLGAGADVVILGHGLVERKFGGQPGILGRRIPIGGRPYTVIGVMPRGFEFPGKSEAWVPLVFDPHEMQERRSLYLDVLARLAPGVSLAQARSEMDAVTRRLGGMYPDANGDVGARVILVHDQIVRAVRTPLLVLLGAVGFVLLIACANVSHLLLARAAGRERELSMRSALGAGRMRLVRQLLAESALLALVAGALGLLMAGWGIRALRPLIPRSVPRLEAIQLDAPVLIFTLACALVSAAVFGVLPALRASRLVLSEALKEGARSVAGTSQRRLRRLLVVGEITLSLVLLSGAGLLISTLWGMMRTDPGFESSHLLTATLRLPPSRYPPARQAAFVESLVERVAGLPSGEGAAVTSSLPLAGGNLMYGFTVEGRAVAGEQPAIASLRAVSPDFHEVLRIPLRRGRLLAPADVDGAPAVVVINEAMAERYWPGGDCLGHRIRISRGSAPAWRTIVGIVGNIRHDALYDPPRPEMYVPFAQEPMPSLSLTVRTAGEPMALAAPLRAAVRDLDPELPVGRLSSMDEVIWNSMAETRFHGTLLGLFAVLAVALAAAGIYGTLSHSLAERAHELAIRVALGALSRDLLGLVLGQYLRLIVAGSVLGLAAASLLTRFLRHQLHGVKPVDPATFAAVTLLLALISLIACYLPARRAARVDPIAALRHK
jgi:putative ABC transport system permease protein